jgi:20S proteasome subunit beta 2
MERQNGGSNAGGFDFELVKRNSMLAAKGMKPPSAWKTGTTIAGVIYKVC